jgi:hypothetical protein
LAIGVDAGTDHLSKVSTGVSVLSTVNGRLAD